MLKREGEVQNMPHSQTAEAGSISLLLYLAVFSDDSI